MHVVWEAAASDLLHFTGRAGIFKFAYSFELYIYNLICSMEEVMSVAMYKDVTALTGVEGGREGVYDPDHEAVLETSASVSFHFVYCGHFQVSLCFFFVFCPFSGCFSPFIWATVSICHFRCY